jgi:hypothetical protein
MIVVGALRLPRVSIEQLWWIIANKRIVGYFYEIEGSWRLGITKLNLIMLPKTEGALNRMKNARWL